MRLHAKVLTLKQRQQVKHLYEQGQSVKTLAERFGVHERTIRRWIKPDSPDDRSSTPDQPRRVIPPADRDNAMTFTMKYTAQDERQTAFPGRNGMIERSHRTDHEE